MAPLGTSERPLRVAVVGSGPAGFYAVDALLKSPTACTVDLFERLPAPYGLARGGVAPDHEKIRKVTAVYDRIAESEGVTYWGNVEIGRDLRMEELQQHFDAIIFASGTKNDRRMGIPGEDLPGSYPATDFVGWYNAHPDYRDCIFDLSQEVAVVIGVGNVAMDVARLLVKTPDELKHTDIATHALDAFAESKVKEVHILGRRGPAQVKFTSKELKEMGELQDCIPMVPRENLRLNDASKEELRDKKVERNLQLLNNFSGLSETRTANRRLHFDFLLSPTEILGEDRVTGIRLDKMRLEGEAFEQRCLSTGETKDLPCGLVFRSIGYHGEKIPGVPFDERRGILPNDYGRVQEEGQRVPGVYVTGWAKRGPSGVIGTNKPDSTQTVQHLLEDISQLTPCVEPDSAAVASLLAERNVRVVDWADWKKIDAAEIARGVSCGKARERFTRVDEMLAVLESSGA